MWAQISAHLSWPNHLTFLEFSFFCSSSFKICTAVVALQCCVTVCCIAKWISYTYTNISPLFWTSFPCRSPQCTEWSSLCYPVGSHICFIHSSVYMSIPVSQQNSVFSSAKWWQQTCLPTLVILSLSILKGLVRADLRQFSFQQSFSLFNSESEIEVNMLTEQITQHTARWPESSDLPGSWQLGSGPLGRGTGGSARLAPPDFDHMSWLSQLWLLWCL